MARVTTDSADDASSEVLSLGAIVLAMSNLSTVLTSLIFIISKSTVEGGKFSKLVTLEFVLTFRNRSSLRELVMHSEGWWTTYSLNNIVNELLRLIDLLLGIGHDETVEIFLLVAGVSSIRPTLAFLDGALSTDCNLGA
jgi:hypothetical protein